MSIDYAKEKLWQAVHDLATSDLSIQDRLASAAMYLIRLGPSDFPERLREEFDAVWRDITRQEPVADEGTIAATTRRLTSEQGARIAERILHIYAELHGGI